jgi:hypothetical protein
MQCAQAFTADRSLFELGDAEGSEFCCFHAKVRWSGGMVVLQSLLYQRRDPEILGDC